MPLDPQDLDTEDVLMFGLGYASVTHRPTQIRVEWQGDGSPSEARLAEMLTELERRVLAAREAD